MLVDQYSKLAIFLVVGLMAALGLAMQHNRDSVFVVMLFCAFTMFLFFLYLVSWLIVGVYVFRRLDLTLANESKASCDEHSTPYMWTFTTLSLILNIGCLVVSWLRPDDKELESSVSSQPRREHRQRVSQLQFPTERVIRSRRY